MLVILNVFDLLLTFYGVTVLQAFGEGNCYWKEEIEKGEYSQIILHKAVFLGLISLGIWVKRGKQHKIFSSSVSIIYLIGLIIYAYTMFHWLFLIIFYHLGLI